ncbi:DUF4153 domain-containing protein [Thalassotalea agariperforans]
MDNQLPKALIIIISLIQGIVLTLLYQSVKYKVWPAIEPVWLTSLVTLAISLPLLSLLSITKNNVKEIIKYLLPFCLLLSVLGGYVGFQQEPIEFINNGTVVAIFCFTALIASFKALMYIQQYMSHKAISYSSLFQLSWRNFIIFGECWLFVGIFFGILHLGAGLFSVLEIDFFKELLKKNWFVIPVLNVAFGFAIIIFRNIIHTVDNISTILHTLIKFLLPALTIVSLGFLATLPFTGLETLWKTGTGSLLIMWLQALTLFFVNAVYQDESHERPYNAILHRLIFIGVGLLPVYSVISAYGLWLRVEQYGLTVDRCWAILIWLILACFSFGYLYGIVKKRDNWLEVLSKVNISMGIVVLVAMLLVNTPILNFQSISASSQIGRLLDDKVTYEDFDYRYFDRSLGRQGYLELQELKKGLPEEYVKTIDRMYINYKHTEKDGLSLTDFDNYATYWPNKDAVPKSLVDAVYQDEIGNNRYTYRDKGYYFIAQDLNNDTEPEFIVITQRDFSSHAELWLYKDNKWQGRYMRAKNLRKNKALNEHISNNRVEVMSPKWNDLKIGDITLSVTSD